MTGRNCKTIWKHSFTLFFKNDLNSVLNLFFTTHLHLAIYVWSPNIVQFESYGRCFRRNKGSPCTHTKRVTTNTALIFNYNFMKYDKE